jgi:hypothetical protein
MIPLNTTTVMIGVTAVLAATTLAVAVLWNDEPAPATPVVPVPPKAEPAVTLSEAEAGSKTKARSAMRTVVAALHRARKEGFVVSDDQRYTVREAMELDEMLSQYACLVSMPHEREELRKRIVLKLAKPA